MHPHNSYLAVKRVNLAAEARDIRRRELKWRSRAKSARAKQKNSDDSFRTMMGLREHRVHVIRPEARSAHLANGFLHGVSYRSIEGLQTRSPPNLKRVYNIAWRYRGDANSRSFQRKFKEWAEDGGLVFSLAPGELPVVPDVPGSQSWFLAIAVSSVVISIALIMAAVAKHAGLY